MSLNARTVRGLIGSVSVLMLLTGCQMAISGSETERAICDAWGDALTFPSRQDTIETARAMEQLRRNHEAACQ